MIDLLKQRIKVGDGVYAHTIDLEIKFIVQYHYIHLYTYLIITFITFIIDVRSTHCVEYKNKEKVFTLLYSHRISSLL